MPMATFMGAPATEAGVPSAAAPPTRGVADNAAPRPWRAVAPEARVEKIAPPTLRFPARCGVLSTRRTSASAPPCWTRTFNRAAPAAPGSEGPPLIAAAGCSCGVVRSIGEDGDLIPDLIAPPGCWYPQALLFSPCSRPPCRLSRLLTVAVATASALTKALALLVLPRLVPLLPARCKPSPPLAAESP